MASEQNSTLIFFKVLGVSFVIVGIIVGIVAAVNSANNKKIKVTNVNADKVEWTGPANAQYECRLDNAQAYSPCTSPYLLSALTPGQHTLLIRTTNMNAQTVETVTINV